MDVRILAATNKNLRQAVSRGTFREDLFFRLNVLEIEAPPLRQRIDDLPLLVSHLLRRLAEKNRKNIRGVSPAFLRMLGVYHWPGNVRELENVLERALILSRADVLDVEVLPPQIVTPDPAPTTPHAPDAQYRHSGSLFPDPHNALHASGPASQGSYGLYPGSGQGTPSTSFAPEHSPHEPPPSATSPLEDAERGALLAALREHGGHREKTAEALGISRRTLQYKLKKFGLNRRG